MICRLLLPVLCLISLCLADSDPYGSGPTGMNVQKGRVANIILPEAATYRRQVKNAKDQTIEHLLRVCNGKNTTKCGYWENVKTKKKVASGATAYNKKKGVLVVKKFQPKDAGTYMTGDRQYLFETFVY
ncbi:unnamed protein product [Caenorhabditis sp. 36 PRJEB53466]|nr:unnamed protein product [Caenorhabditis sp. 36 PRJEB53466]